MCILQQLQILYLYRCSGVDISSHLDFLVVGTFRMPASKNIMIQPVLWLLQPSAGRAYLRFMCLVKTETDTRTALRRSRVNM